jgi:exonuclease VII small subunit
MLYIIKCIQAIKNYWQGVYMDKPVDEVIEVIRETIKDIVEEREPSKANHCKMSLLDLITFAILCHIYCGGVYKKAHAIFIEKMSLFPKVRYNKVVERLNRYEDLLDEAQKIFVNTGVLMSINSDPVETKTKEIVENSRHEKKSFKINPA